MSLPREEPQVIFATPAKEHFAGACAILVFSSVIENGLNLLLKNLWSGAEGESVLLENRIYRSKIVIKAGQRVSCSGKVILRIFKDIHKSISWNAKEETAYR